MITTRTLLGAALACVLTLSPACSDDAGDDQDTLTSDADATTAPDTEDAADTTDDDVPPVCENTCLDQFGKNDRSLCPVPQSDWRCEAGCCVAIFKCETNDDCATQGFDEGHCEDDRFACHCNTETARCFEWLCGGDDDCPGDEVCSAGACQAAAPVTGLSPRILNGPIVLTPGATAQLFVEAYDPTDIDVVATADATFSSGAQGVANVDSMGVVTGGDTPGVSTITVTLTGAGTTAEIDVRTVVPVTGELTVIVVDERTGGAITGSWALVSRADGVVISDGAIPVNGVILSDADLGDGADLHVFGDGHDWVSFLGLEGGETLYAPVAQTTYSLVDLDLQGAITEDSELVNVGIVEGVPDDTAYRREGQIELSLTSFGLSSALFDFSLPVLLGADVRRYLDPEHNIPQVDNSDPITAPGGIIFGLAGPAIPRFVLTAPEGTHRMWTLGGRLDLSEIAEYTAEIIDSVGGGDLDITRIASSIFPTFSAFWSGYDPAITVTTTESIDAVVAATPVLRMPLGLGSSLDVPPLPAIADLGWADALFFLGGALTPDGELVPLGLNGGADTSNRETNPPDGLADSNEKTAAKDPYNLPLAPLHSGLQGPHTRYGIAVVAVAIPSGSSDRRPDSGSAIIYHGEVGAGPPAAPDLGAFLGFPTDSTWDRDAREVVLGAVDGADLQRVLFKGKKGAHWTIWANGQTTARVPTPSDLFDGLVDRATENVEVVMINSLDLRDGLTPAEILAPGGVTYHALVNHVVRLSFIDVRDPIFPPAP